MKSRQVNKRNPKKVMRATGPHRRIVVSDSFQFVDKVLTVNASTTASRFSIFTDIITLLATIPQITDPIIENGNVEWRARIFISHIEMRILAVGSQSNTLVAGDLFNNVRFIVAQNRDSFSIASTPALTGVTAPLELCDTRIVYLDHMYNLMTRAFNGAGYNVPAVQNSLFNVKINECFDFFTLVTVGSTGWDTKVGNIEVATVSDSSVTPNPSLNFTIRTYFKILKGSDRDRGQ